MAVVGLACLAGGAGGCGAFGGDESGDPAAGSNAAPGAPPQLHDTARGAVERDRSDAGRTLRAPAAAATSTRDPAEVTDAAGRVVRFTPPARRIVSLVPGVTETLVALGAAGQLVGRTRYDSATAVRALPSVGGGLDPSVEAVLALRPDLVVSWATGRDQGFGDQLRAAGVTTLAVRIEDTAAVFRTVTQLGRLTGRPSAAATLNARLRDSLAAVRANTRRRPAVPTVLFVVWPDPPTIAGPHTFIMQVVGVSGGRPAFPDVAKDWPQLSMEEVVRRQPDLVLVPVGEAGASAVARLTSSPGWRGLRAVREGRVSGIDADLATRPGPGIARAARAIRDSIDALLARHPL